LALRRSVSPLDDKAPREHYAEYLNQSCHTVSGKIEYVRSKSQFDAHIAEIKGRYLEASFKFSWYRGE
jgi:hypothetical protein